MKKLQDLLSEARRVKGVSLREVERATGISNAYVSQLETGAVAEPSPRKLLALSEYFGISYGLLMNACGYVLPEQRMDMQNSATEFMGERLTIDESAAVAAFLHELRRRRGRK